MPRQSVPGSELLRVNQSDAITPYYQRRSPSSRNKDRFHWVIGVHSDWIDDAPYPGVYLAAQARFSDYFTEIGVLGQRLPRDGADVQGKTRYFMTVRFTMNQPISPYGMIGANPLQWLFDSGDMRLDLHAQAGLSWQDPSAMLRVDAYGAMYSFETRRPYDPTETWFDQERRGNFERTTEWALGLRLSLMF
ncbi:hypothetical protein [Alkalimonas sp.]|uniref:hypothetical protein n=1 Tax=Alkalimonas sp. TaxID=1872453 RepID=UPI00263AC92B|nr:hypothetical protein [Alkalimonas sp.]MCC5824529.1 hypothetical protein [Alkalimonas sp.]